VQDMTNVNYWLVVRNKKTGDFQNARFWGNKTLIEENVNERFIKEHPLYEVIHCGMGDLPPKGYRSLPYIDIKTTNKRDNSDYDYRLDESVEGGRKR
jgi:hypothetical protein